MSHLEDQTLMGLLYFGPYSGVDANNVFNVYALSGPNNKMSSL